MSPVTCLNWTASFRVAQTHYISSNTFNSELTGIALERGGAENKVLQLALSTTNIWGRIGRVVGRGTRSGLKQATSVERTCVSNTAAAEEKGQHT